MKYWILIAVVILSSCQEKKENTAPAKETAQDLAEVSQDSLIGLQPMLENVLLVEDLNSSLKADSLMVVRGTVTSVCKMKGCWMELDQGNGESLRVDFKDYALFMPKDLPGKEVIIRGIASKKTLSVESLRHFAEDAGKSKEEIEKITEARTTLSFEADGVLILNKDTTVQ
jgi:hypothetical protein